jgi:hypothetical protein
VRIGKLVAAHYICVGSIGPATMGETCLERHVSLRAYVTVSIRVIDVESSNLVFETSVTETEEGWQDLTPDDALYISAGRLAVKEIIRRFENEVAMHGSIVEVMPDHRFLVDLGTQHGLEAGVRLDGYRDSGFAMASNGSEVKVADSRVGEIQIVQVGPTSSIARRLRGKGLKAGDYVVSKAKQQSSGLGRAELREAGVGTLGGLQGHQRDRDPGALLGHCGRVGDEHQQGQHDKCVRFSPPVPAARGHLIPLICILKSGVPA